MFPTHPSSCAQRSVVDGAMQTQDLSRKYSAAREFKIPDQRRSNEELPRRIRDDGQGVVGPAQIAAVMRNT